MCIFSNFSTALNALQPFFAFVSFLPRAFVALASSYLFLSAYNPWRNRFSNIRDEAAHTKKPEWNSKIDSTSPHKPRASSSTVWTRMSIFFCFVLLLEKIYNFSFFSVSFSINHQTNKPGTEIYTQIYGSMGRLSHYARFWFRAKPLWNNETTIVKKIVGKCCLSRHGGLLRRATCGGWKPATNPLITQPHRPNQTQIIENIKMPGGAHVTRINSTTRCEYRFLCGH